MQFQQLNFGKWISATLAISAISATDFHGCTETRSVGMFRRFGEAFGVTQQMQIQLQCEVDTGASFLSMWVGCQGEKKPLKLFQT